MIQSTSPVTRYAHISFSSQGSTLKRPYSEPKFPLPTRHLAATFELIARAEQKKEGDQRCPFWGFTQEAKDIGRACYTDTGEFDKVRNNDIFLFLLTTYIGALLRIFDGSDIFITFTANPHWVEIEHALLPGQLPHDRPDLMSRVLHLKFKSPLSDVMDRHVFGRARARAHVYTVRYQKRGLPHVHPIVFLDPAARLASPLPNVSMPILLLNFRTLTSKPPFSSW